MAHKGAASLAQRCDLCGKAPTSGSNVSHSQRHTKRRFRPNVQSKRLVVEGESIKLKVCTRCLRSAYKSAKAA
jgi:large subunit ribosomal protein L28